MTVHDSLKELSELLENNGNFVNANLTFAEKMLKQVPANKREEMMTGMREVRKSIKLMDKGKLMDTIKNMNNYNHGG